LVDVPSSLLACATATRRLLRETRCASTSPAQTAGPRRHVIGQRDGSETVALERHTHAARGDPGQLLLQLGQSCRGWTRRNGDGEMGSGTDVQCILDHHLGEIRCQLAGPAPHSGCFRVSQARSKPDWYVA
jgi:hypothetical protein